MRLAGGLIAEMHFALVVLSASRLLIGLAKVPDVGTGDLFSTFGFWTGAADEG
jgi:hypothetical protein